MCLILFYNVNPENLTSSRNSSDIESMFSSFDRKPLFFVYFGQFLATFLTVFGYFFDTPWALYWLDQNQRFSDYWIELYFELNHQSLFWIEFSGCNIETNIELNHFSAKFKYWIESDMVSPTPISWFIGYRPGTIWCISSSFKGLSGLDGWDGMVNSHHGS